MFKTSGKRTVHSIKRTNRDSDPGSLLGEKHVTCFRCDNQFPITELYKIPPKAKPGDTYMYVCLDCLSTEEKKKWLQHLTDC